MSLSKKRSFNEMAEPTTSQQDNRVLQSWEKFDFLLTSSYKLNESRTKSIIVGLKLDTETSKFVPCIAIVDEKSCGIVCSSEKWQQFTTVLKKLTKNFNLPDAQYRKLPNDTTSLEGYIFQYSSLGSTYGKAKLFTIMDVTDQQAGAMPKYVRKVTMRQNTVQNIYEFEELINSRLKYLQKLCEPCNECLNQLIIPVKEIMPRIRQNFGDIELSEEIISKFVIGGLKNASVNEKIKSSLEATHSWFTADYLELVMLELILFFTKDIITKVTA